MKLKWRVYVYVRLFVSHILLYTAYIPKSKQRITVTLTENVIQLSSSGIVVKENFLRTTYVSQIVLARLVPSIATARMTNIVAMESAARIVLGNRVFGIVTVPPESAAIMMTRNVQQEIVT